MNIKQTLIAAAAASLLGGASFVVASSSWNSNDDLFKANVEALTACESHAGGCREIKDDCFAICPDCGEMIFAPGHHGPAYGIKGN